MPHHLCIDCTHHLRDWRGHMCFASEFMKSDLVTGEVSPGQCVFIRLDYPDCPHFTERLIDSRI
jgi:hypothetical protein